MPLEEGIAMICDLAAGLSFCLRPRFHSGMGCGVENVICQALEGKPDRKHISTSYV